MVEHLVYTERVGGSSPSPPTIFRVRCRRFLSWESLRGFRDVQSARRGNFYGSCPGEVHPGRSSSRAKFVAVEGLGLLCAEIGHGDCAGKERIADIQDLYPEGHGSARCDTNGWAGEEGEP